MKNLLVGSMFNKLVNVLIDTGSDVNLIRKELVPTGTKIKTNSCSIKNGKKWTVKCSGKD